MQTSVNYTTAIKLTRNNNKIKKANKKKKQNV